MFGIPDDVAFHFCVPLGYPKGNFGPNDASRRQRRPSSTDGTLRFRGSERHADLRRMLTSGPRRRIPGCRRQRLAGEAAVERLELEAGDVEQPEPFVLRRPPERARRTVVERRCRCGCRRLSTAIVCGTGSSWCRAVEARPRCGGRRRTRSTRTDRRAGATRRHARTCGGGRPRSGHAGARGTGSRSAPPARRARGRACRLRAARARRPPAAAANARLLEHRRRSVDADHRAGRSPARRGSRRGRCRPRAPPAARRLPRELDVERRRRRSCAPTIRRSGRRTPRPSSSADRTGLRAKGAVIFAGSR